MTTTTSVGGLTCNAVSHSAENETSRASDTMIAARSAVSGIGHNSFRSRRPGLSKAGSMSSGRFEAYGQP